MDSLNPAPATASLGRLAIVSLATPCTAQSQYEADRTSPPNSVLAPDWGYRDLQEPYERLGDTFLTACPGHLILWSQDPGVIREIMARREHFRKPTEVYEILTLFGDNVLTTEGQLWRLHRKATSATFNERNAAQTFGEAVRQTQGLVAKWVAQGQESGQQKTIHTLDHDTMTLALNIISYVWFGLRFFWPGQALPKDLDPKLEKYGIFEPPPGHSMTFAQSVAMVLHRIFLLLLIPQWLLRALTPSPWLRGKQLTRNPHRRAPPVRGN